MAERWVRPVVLMGQYVRMEPLSISHAPEIFEAAKDPGIWRYIPKQPRPFADEAEARAWIDTALRDAGAGREQPFAIIHRDSGRVAGSTRYMDIHPAHRGLEIGYTWIAPEFQRTPINTECKLLLFSHAFEDLGAIRVCLKTDSRNDRSQRAIERLGAVREGVWRNHYILADGYRRDSVYYSVIDSEWPRVKSRLLGFLERGRIGK